MEQIDEFQKWMEQMLSDAKKKLGMSDETLAFLLMEKALDYYARSMARRQLRDESSKSSRGT